MNQTYLTTEELAFRIKYTPRTIRQSLKDTAFIQGVHYIKPFGGSKVLYIWEQVEKEMLKGSKLDENELAMQ